MTNSTISVVNQFRSFVDRFQDVDQMDSIVTHDGTLLPRRNFESAFHKKIDWELHDPEKAELIAKAFTKHFRSALQPGELPLLEDWLVKNIRYLGFFPFEPYWQGVKEEPIAQLFSRYAENFHAFFEEIRCSESPSHFPVVRNPNQPLNIVIITTTGGGGHKSVADATAQILGKYPLKYRVSVMDIAEISKPSDTIYRTSGLLSGEEVYDKIYQQEKEAYLADQIWQLKPKLNEFTADTSMKEMKEKIRCLNPDLVLSTCHFWERDLEVASSLCVPLHFIHCDYELSWALVPVMANINPQVVKMWLPANDPEILHPVSTRLKSELVSQLRLSHSEEEIEALIDEKMSSITEYSGYPVRASFKPNHDPEVIKALRNQIGVAEGAQVVTLQMGKQGVGALEDTVKALNEDRSIVYAHPLHVAVMCGKNEALVNRLQVYLNGIENHPQIKFEILPFLDERQTADYLKITDVEVMKPGGAATAEALEMGVKTLFQVMPDHPWEKCNGNQMVRHHLGEELESLSTLPKQLKGLLNKANEGDYTPINAEEAIPQLVEKAVAEFDIYHQKNIPTDAVFERTPPQNVKQINEMLGTIHEILTTNEIPYWINGGTLLGAVRNQGLIPWDDDGDLQIFEKEKEKLLALGGEFAARGYTLVDHEFGLKLFPKGGHFPSIDIFTADLDPNSGNYVLGNEKARETWPQDYWTAEELKEIVPYKFGPITLMGSKTTDRYLTTLYKKSYKDVAYRIYDHAHNRMHHKQAVRIVDRGPAKF